MAYDYSKAYNKRRNELIQTRKALSKMGVPLSSVPTLPRKPKTISKAVNSEMTNILRETKQILKAETYIKKHPNVTREARLLELESQRQNKNLRERQRRQEKKALQRYRERAEFGGDFSSVMIQNFAERIEKIPYFYRKDGTSFYGRDTIKQWWYSVQNNLYTHEIARLLSDAQERGISLELEKMYEETRAEQFVDAMLDLMKESEQISQDDYETVVYEMNELNESWW